ncbi:hypothetical protein [Fodinibius sediminis]|uniref:Collagen-binding domain of a collagenase n=1 Tax=Fodinibius sediminis TaxID=1214077 RepID=A0A521DPD2_9BACT|nr:hypothetical protein [Fodinibius sediminis]SMO73589.1 hypothetical protein SAMN06265218_11182 [Fodinibius sediminis]
MKHHACYLITVLIAILLFLSRDVLAQAAVQPSEENPYYWQYQEKPVLLLGGSTDDNLFQISELKQHLSAIADAGGNYIRNTMSDRSPDGVQPGKGRVVYAFKEIDSGKFDLNRWNETYWKRFENMLRWTYERDIIVQIEIWDRFDYSRENWPPHPYNPQNNINYSYRESGFEPQYPEHPGANKQPFFFTTPGQDHNKVVLQYQRKFVDKLLDYTLKYPHVLYCIDNETSGEEAWAVYWAEFIQQRAKQENRKVYITEMWDDWDLTQEQHRRTLDHPERFAFVDVSQNNHQRNETHWQNFHWVRNYVKEQPRPINNVKIYGADDGRHGGNNIDAVEKFWRLIFAGAASARFHRPTSGIGLSELAVKQLRSARLFLKEFDIVEADPDPRHDYLVNRDEDEAYLNYIGQEQFAVYFTDGGEVELRVPGAQREWHLRWLDITKSQWLESTLLTAGDTIPLQAPGKGPWLVVVTSKGAQ